MSKILVRNPVVEINGDEMARVMWEKIKKQLILPYLDIKLLEYDLGIKNRDKTNDKVTIEAGKAIKENNVGVKCATITPDDKRVKEFNLKKKYPSPNGTIRNILNGTIFREPIIIEKIPRFIKHWGESVVIARHAYGDIYQSQEIKIKKKGKLYLKFESDDKKTLIEKEVCKFNSSGVGLSYFNNNKSIEDFAYSCFNFGLDRKMPVYLSTKNTILQSYDESFKEIFEKVYNNKYKLKFQKSGIFYQHRLIDDMIACLVKWTGGFLWACKNYDGDVISDLVAQGFGSLGLMTSVLQSPDGKIVETEAAHGTVTSHFRQHQNGLETSTNPIASIFAWTRALLHRGKIDKNKDLENFSNKIELICKNLLNKGMMTKDLALMIGPDQKWLTTQQLIDSISYELKN
ncbi:MAG: isocitrate dehydrogenase (NADP(+)) [Rickettsiales bacterium]|nr:isocitrate dehydrogenase (NADP(+)) [Rickettsiales bacterium]OUT44091.1 MAG: isocitrate dehydrogenase [Pelagibacteraceae bacterium TMED13]|tara:strand:- start:79 stop:1284 length:1206 start_codon:yes stop_codon:yes gene_type:complete